MLDVFFNLDIINPGSDDLMIESIDWARTLLALGVSHIDSDVIQDTLHVLLKYQTDVEKVASDLGSLTETD